MSQHDFNIANQGFPATRADINNAFQAIASNSSGATAPSTTYANMWWYDTTNNKMYLRNEADSAWIEVATIDQTNNEWQITTGVVQAKDSDGLALKTDDGTTRLFIKDSDGNVGIGTSSPSAPTEIVATSSGSSTDLLHLRNNATATDTGSTIKFVNSTSGNSNSGSSEITAIRTGTNTGDLTFSTSNSSASITEAMRIDSSGNVGIGTSSPDANLDIESNLPTLRLTETDDSTYSEISQSFGYLTINADAGNAGSGDGIIFKVDNAERMRVLSSGGITFNGDTAAANALDDYEEGTWTPSANAGMSGFTIVSATYVKIGRSVTLMAYLSNPTSKTSSHASIGGMPFTPASDHYATGSAETNVTGHMGIVRTNSNNTYLSLFYPNATSSVRTNLLGTDIGTHIIFSITYQTP